MAVRLYGMAISHPSVGARLMLEQKGIDYKLTELMPGSQRLALRALGFRGGTVPALKIDRRRVQTSRRISRALEELQPDPPLFGVDPTQRAAIEAAERWGDEELQPIPRRAFRWILSIDQGRRTRMTSALGIPAPAVAAALMKPIASYYARLVSADEEGVRTDMERLPQLLDHVDALIADGTIGGDLPNAADFQIAPTIATMMRFEDLRVAIAGRPAEALARRLAPSIPLAVDAFLPASMKPPLKPEPVAAE